MKSLNFPKYQFRFKKDETGRPLIFDRIRKKWLVITPEEWVRQHWCQHLVEYYKIPEGSIQIESGLTVAQRSKRSDILVNKKGQPHTLIECKRPTVEINQNTLQQSIQYNSVYSAENIILTNGIKHICFRWDNIEKAYFPTEEFRF
jgi:hypothetical protein